jgi:hypothetical protein
MSNIETLGTLHPDDMPNIVPVTELTWGDLHAPSGIIDTIVTREGDSIDIELTNLQAIELFEGVVHEAQGVFIKDQDANGVYTVFSQRPTELQAKELYKLRADTGIDPENPVHTYSWQPEKQH